jgi:hypothetical protein
MTNDVLVANNPTTLRLVRERWYHRLFDRVRSRRHGIPLGTVSFTVYVGDNGLIYAEKEKIDVSMGRALFKKDYSSA